MGLIGRLDRGARKRAMRRLGPLMRLDEEIIDYDVATLDTNPRVRLDFVATQRALYVVDARSREISRIPYESIRSVMWGGDSPFWRGRFWVRLHDGQQIPSTMKPGHRGLADYVESRVRELVVFERHVERESGRGATFRYRRFSERGDPGWIVDPDEGVDLDDPYWDPWIRDVMATMKPEADRAVGRSESGRIYNVRWGNGGARFEVQDNGEIVARLHDDTVDTGPLPALHEITFEQAWGDLEIALGRKPSLQHTDDWKLGTFEWEPPLPAYRGDVA